MDCEDPRDLIAEEYDVFGRDNSDPSQADEDHDKVLRASIGSLPVGFLRTLIFRLLDNRVSFTEWEQFHLEKDAEIEEYKHDLKVLKARIAELEDHR